MSNTASFMVYTGPNGVAKVHRAECSYCVGDDGQGQFKTKYDRDWSPFSDYASARVYAERMRDKMWDHLDVDCRRCRPGTTI